MSEKTAIQWCDHTFNPWYGCAKVAPECKNCYAETLMDKRYHKVKWGKGQERKRTSPANWREPLKWNVALPPMDSKGDFRRARVFCLSLGDWMDEEVPIEWLRDLLMLIHDTGNLDWLLLTKRPGEWRERIGRIAFDQIYEPNIHFCKWVNDWYEGRSPYNVWIGVSAGADQRAAIEIPARIHFLSCEPMLQPLDHFYLPTQEFDWIIFGGESGKNARPCDVGWIRDGLKFCQRNDIRPFVKQLGAKPYWVNHEARSEFDVGGGMLKLKDSHGGDMKEWPQDLRVREFPDSERLATA